MKILNILQAALLASFVLPSAAFSTELPIHSTMDEALPKADSALVGEIMAASVIENPDKKVLKVFVRLKEEVFGVMPKQGTFECEYIEQVAKVPNDPNLHISFENYTGSGIEFMVKPGEQYLMLFAEASKGKGANLLRIDPVSRKNDMLKIMRRMKK